MKLAIMQPYFLPYIGYFQLVGTVDLFILYDNIKYTKKGWINRNRILLNGKDAMFTLPLEHGSDSLNVDQRKIAMDFCHNKLLNKFMGAYSKAPYFKQTISLIEEIMQCEERNLFAYLHRSIIKICEYLGITTPIQPSSQVLIDTTLKGQDKVLALCKVTGATCYINAIGGLELYSQKSFREQSVTLKFLKSRPFKYPQFGNEFVPWLSIVDVMMFNPINVIRERIASGYDLI